MDPARAQPWRILDSEPVASGDPTPPRPASFALVGGAIALVSLLLVVVASLAVVLVARPADPAGPQPPGLAAAGPDDSVLLVEVGGAVTRPGIYRLAEGSRLADAISAAGGYSPRVDAAAAAKELNLAGFLGDGDQIVVPSRDLTTTQAANGGASGDPAGGRVDLNTATQAELEALPGIGPVTAAKIVAARDERPFKTVDELLERKVVGQATLAKIRDLVNARG